MIHMTMIMMCVVDMVVVLWWVAWLVGAVCVRLL